MSFLSLKVGDMVLAGGGGGMLAELRSTFVNPTRTPSAVVRWEGSAHHSRVPWYTVREPGPMCMMCGQPVEFSDFTDLCNSCDKSNLDYANKEEK